MGNLILINFNLLKVEGASIRVNENGEKEVCIPIERNGIYTNERCANISLALVPNNKQNAVESTHVLKMSKPKNISKEEYKRFPKLGVAREYVFEDSNKREPTKNTPVIDPVTDLPF